MPGSSMQDCPHTPDYHAATGYGTVPGCPGGPPAAESPAIAQSPAIPHDEYSTDHRGFAPATYGVLDDGHGLAHPPADALPEAQPYREPPDVSAGPDFAAPRSGGAAARWAVLGYLTVPLFGFVVPLLVYLRALRGPRWARAHAAQALNVWITVLLYDLSAVIMGTMLALDSPQIALIVFAPLVVGLWLVALVFLVRAASAASQGREYTAPRWLCSPVIR
jgi:uncharacterized Tic20 family protein